MLSVWGLLCGLRHFLEVRDLHSEFGEGFCFKNLKQKFEVQYIIVKCLSEELAFCSPCMLNVGCMSQAHVVLPAPTPKQSSSLRVLVASTEEWCLEAKTWEAGVLMATVALWLLDSQW